VAVVLADGTTDIRAVEPGERQGDLWIIDKGLKAGESVIVSGLQYVRAGMTVKARPFAPETASASSAGAPAGH
jgi:membrane fusion protein, multidrug efflux system